MHGVGGGGDEVVAGRLRPFLAEVSHEAASATAEKEHAGYNEAHNQSKGELLVVSPLARRAALAAGVACRDDRHVAAAAIGAAVLVHHACGPAVNVCL